MKPFSLKILNDSFQGRKSPKSESKILHANQNNTAKHNLHDLSGQNSENCLFAGKFQLKNLNQKYYSKNSTHSSSKLSTITKPNLVNNINNHHLDLFQKNKYCHENISKKNNNIHSNDNKNFIYKNNNINVTKPIKQVIILNKKIKREKNTKKTNINLLKPINTKNIDNKYIPINSYLNKNANNIIKENNNRSITLNYSQGNINKGLSFKDNLKYDDYNNNEISQPLKIINKKDKKENIHNKNYKDIEFSTYNQNNFKINKNIYDNEFFENSKIMKRELYMKNPSKNEYIINTYIYNSPIEQHNIINNKNYITSKVNNSPSDQKKSGVYDYKNNAPPSPKNKNIEKNKISYKSKNIIPFDKTKINSTNKIQNKKILDKNELNNDSNKINEINNNIKMKKNIFYSSSPNIFKDELSFQISKKNVKTSKEILKENELDNKSVQIPFNVNKDKILAKEIPKMHKNKSNLLNNIDAIESEKKNKNIGKYYNTQENINYYNLNKIESEYLGDDIQSICIIDPRGNLNNNFIKISNMNKSTKNVIEKNNKNYQMFFSKTSSYKKNLNSTSRNALNNNKYDVLNLKNISIKRNIINLNDNDNNSSEQNNENRNKINKDNKMKNNKSIINIRSNAPNTLFKSIKTGKNLSPMKLNHSRKEKDDNYELLNNIPSLKINSLLNQNQKNKNLNKSLNSKDDKVNNNHSNIKEVNCKNSFNNASLDENKNKDKNENIKKKKKINYNFSENNIDEATKNAKQFSDKKQNKKEINMLKVNLDGLKINYSKNTNSKIKNEINTFEQNKNQMINDIYSSSDKKVKQKIQTMKLLDNIYIKPNFISPKNNKPFKTERKYNKLLTNSSRNNTNINNKYAYIKTSYNQPINIDKNLYPTNSPKLKIHKPSNLTKIKIKNDNQLLNSIKEFDSLDENKVRENIIKKYCFIQKYNDYFLRRPLIYKCFIEKIFKNNSSQINSDYFSKSRDELENNNDNDFNKTLSIKNITFADNNKKSIEKVNSLDEKCVNKNESDNKINNDKVNEEEKLNSIKQSEQIEILNDNFLDNEDIKLNYSDDNIIEGNSIKIYSTTLGKEIEDSEKKVSKTYIKKENKNNLENVQKGLFLLKNIAERIESNSNEEYDNDIINSNNNKKNTKIFYETNKSNDLIKNKKDYKINLTEGNYIQSNDSYKIIKNRFSESVDKNCLIKGITKIENFFEKKLNSKINTYQKTNKKMRIKINSKEDENQIISTEKKSKLNTYIHTDINKESTDLNLSKENNKIINNINIIKNEDMEESDDFILLLNKNIFNENKSDDKNKSTKLDILYQLNIITDGNYSDVLNNLTEIIINNKDNKINIDDIVNNEKYFKDIVFNKLFSETKFIKIYSKLIKDLNENIQLKLKENNIKNIKEKTLKFLINEECVNILNKYKNIQNEIALDNFDSINYFLCRKNLREYVSFIYEFINNGLLKQQFGINIIEQFYKKYQEDNTSIIYKNIYLDACIILFDKLFEAVFESNNQKLIQYLNNFIDNLSKDNNNELQNYLRYKIINSKEKKNIKYKKEKEDKKITLDLFDKVIEEEVKNKVNFEKIVKDKNKENNKNILNDEFGLIIQEDLINYISYFTDKNDNNQTIIKTEVDKSYNWKAIDDIINEKLHGLGYIINKFIESCSNIISKESQVILANDYIKNIIEYYVNNLPKEEIEKIHNEMIKTYQNINEIINTNHFMCKILGNLLFILIENKLYHIKDFNNYLKDEKNTHINLAIITKYCIISSGKFAKKYFNDFKQTKLFMNNMNIFNEYVYKALNDLFYFFK